MFFIVALPHGQQCVVGLFTELFAGLFAAGREITVLFIVVWVVILKVSVVRCA
jgi:hypothetical protein